MSSQEIILTSQPTLDACSRYRRQVRSASLRAISFLSSTFHQKIVVPQALHCLGDVCDKYSSDWKRFLSSFLISFLADEVVPDFHLGKDDSLSLAASLNSITKSWPDSCDCMGGALASDLYERLTKEKRTLPEGYLEFVRFKVRELFPKGIREKSLKRRAVLVTPPFSSTTCAGRKDGGSYSYWEGRQEEFLNSDPELIHEPAFMVAKDAGKPRPLVKNHPSYLYLRPLHQYLYDRLSKNSWLLRGEFTRASLLRAGFSPRKTYLSADFSAATDGLPIEVAEAIIDELAFLSPQSLSGILSAARASLRPAISGLSTSVVIPTTGQLMGNLLSFPLLCMQNYIAACWVDERVGEVTPKLINGDDLAVEASEVWCREYRLSAPGLGLTLNEKKTGYSSSFVTMNSTYLNLNFKIIPFVKCRSLFTFDPRQVGRNAESCLGAFRKTRSTRSHVLYRNFLALNEKTIRKGGRSLFALGLRLPSQGRCIPVSLWRREKVRTDWELSIPKAVAGLHPSLVLCEENQDLVDDKIIAPAIVKAHWEMGPFEAPGKEKLVEVLRYLKSTATRRGRERAVLADKRLRQKREVEKVVWVPIAVRDCLQLCHDRSRLVGDSLFFEDCGLCERVEGRMREMSARKRNEEEEEEALRREALWALFDVSKDGSLLRQPDVIW
jgi:hypothetical protein